MTFFLKLKHWQVFILVILLPAFLFFLFAGLSLNDIISNEQFDFTSIVEILKSKLLVFSPIIGVYVTFRLLLFTSMGFGLKNELNFHSTWHKPLFIVTLLVPYLISSIMYYYFSEAYYDFFSSLSEQIKPTNNPLKVYATDQFSSRIKSIAPLNIINLACFAYTFYIIAKTLKSAELKREAEIGDFSIEIVLLYFYFVGVWNLQPRFNALVNNSDTKSNKIPTNENREKFKPRL